MEDNRLYDVIGPRGLSSTRQPRRARTINHPPSPGNSYYASPRSVQPPSPPPPRAIPPVPPRNKSQTEDGISSQLPSSLPNTFGSSPGDRWNNTMPLIRNRSTSTSSQGEPLSLAVITLLRDRVLVINSNYPPPSVSLSLAVINFSQGKSLSLVGNYMYSPQGDPLSLTAG